MCINDTLSDKKKNTSKKFGSAKLFLKGRKKTPSWVAREESLCLVSAGCGGYNQSALSDAHKEQIKYLES